MRCSKAPTGIAHSVTAALLLVFSAASQVQADPSATDSLPQAVTPASAVAMMVSVRPDGARSHALAEGLADHVDGAGSIVFFGSLLRAASLGDLLDLGGTYTLFVPVDEAFSRMTGQQISDLIHNPGSLRSLVAAHIVPGRVLVTDLKHGRAVFSISGARVEPSPAARPQLNGAPRIRAALAGPIMVHIIDGLLQRPKPSDA
jgi:uncharacterized surface protein with fasciclin (FAS1) repeats